MNVQSKFPTTPDEFLRWNEGREGKREFVNGRVVEMMINVTRSHVDIASNLIMTLGPQLDRSKFSFGSGEFSVRTAEGIRYPDFFIDRRLPQSQRTDLAATEPLLLAEILSPSSYGRDFIDKVADYERMDSLLYYLILSQDEARVWLWSRSPDGWVAKPMEVVGEDETVTLPALDLTMPLASVYAGIELRP